MTEPRVTPHSAPRNLAEYYHWEEAGRGIRIYMHSAMADRLQAAVLGAAKTETGGILLGRLEEDSAGTVTFIDDFVAVPCSHRDGAAYDLKDRETDQLEAALLRAAIAGCESPAAPAILGYYRSHIREGLSLSAADLEVINSYFETPASVFLVVKAAAGAKACTAGFFFWEDGHIQSEFSSLEVALGSLPSLPPAAAAAHEAEDPEDDLPADLREMFRKAALPEPAREPAAPYAPAQPAPQGRAPRLWPGLLLRAATIVFATAALVISALNYLSAPRSPGQQAASVMTPAISMLGLRVERNPPDLLVTWNRNAPVVIEGRRATLFIRDGRIQRNVAVDKARLDAGTFLYTPASDSLEFRLEVYGADDGSVSQSIRVPGAR